MKYIGWNSGTLTAILLIDFSICYYFILTN